jgi:hypothetical protein
MGIETDWTLSANKPINNEMFEEICTISDYDWWDQDTEKELTLCAKWYDAYDNMLLISAKFPDVTFTLHGINEMHEDYGKRKFLAGKEIVKERKPRRKSKEKAALQLLEELIKGTPTNSEGEICNINHSVAFKAKKLLEE